MNEQAKKKGFFSRMFTGDAASDTAPQKTQPDRAPTDSTDALESQDVNNPVKTEDAARPATSPEPDQTASTNPHTVAPSTPKEEKV